MFANRLHDLFTAPTTDAKEAETRLALVASAPPVHPSEVESDHDEVLETVVLWGSTVIATRHLEREGSITIGEAEGSIATLPMEAIGGAYLEVARATSAGYVVSIPIGASATTVKAGQTSRVEGPAEITTARGDRVSMRLGGFELRIAHVAAGRRVPAAPLTDRLRSGAIAQVLGAAFLHVAVLGGLAYYMPSMLADEGDEARADQMMLMQQYLVSAAEREKDESKEQAVTEGNPGDSTPSSGAQAKGNEGKMGKENAPQANARYGIAGDKNNPDPHMARERALTEARNFGIIGLLGGSAGDPNAPTAPWGGPDSLGVDPKSAMGSMFGADIGDSAGFGGLGLTGVGEGGGGKFEGIGLDTIGTLGHGRGGLGDGPGGFGGCKHEPCGGLGKHQATAPTLRDAGKTEVNGHIPAEVIQRIVRQNFGRFRSCYESGLRDNPGLAGRVVTRFVVSREGAVTQAFDGGSDLANRTVVACVNRAFYALSFPEHEGGLVTVVYPLAFSPQ